MKMHRSMEERGKKEKSGKGKAKEPSKLAILKLTKEKKVVTTTEVAKEISISWNTAENYLLELALENKIIRIKKEGVNLWILK